MLLLKYADLCLEVEICIEDHKEIEKVLNIFQVDWVSLVDCIRCIVSRVNRF